MEIIDEINDLLQEGIISHSYYAEFNSFVWKNVANEINFLYEQDEYIQKAFGFMQHSAQTNFILSLAKVYDKPSKNNPTKCFERFIEVVKKNCNKLDSIPLTQMTIELLEKYECPAEMIEAIRSQDSSKFFLLFCDYYKSKYDTPSFQTDLTALRKFRNKAVAHNETLEVKITDEILQRLFSFAEEVYLVFDLAFNQRISRHSDSMSHRGTAEREAYFVNHLIEILKRDNDHP